MLEHAVVRPVELAQFPHLAESWDKTMKESRLAYRQILGGLTEQSNLSQDRREAIRAMRSAARSVLPNTSETVIAVTFNARSLRHFLTVRGSIIGDANALRFRGAVGSYSTGRPRVVF